MKPLHNPFSRRHAIQGMVAAVAAPAIVTPARAQAKVTWRVQSHWPKASTSFGDSLVPLAAELEKRTGGRFKLELLGAGEIAKGAEIFNIVRKGVIPMGTTSPAYNPQEAPLMNMYMGVPGAFAEIWQMEYFTKTMGLEDKLNESLKSKGVFMKAEKTYPTELVLKNPIKEGEDLSKIKIRSAGSLIDYFAAAGFVPQKVDGPELYQALATGVVDGAHWGAAQGALSMKFWEVAKYEMRPSVLMANDVFVINSKEHQKLPDDLRLIFDSLIEERYYQRSIQYQYGEAVAMATGVSKYGVKVEQYPKDVMAKFAKATRDILAKDMEAGPDAKAMGEKLIELQKALGLAT